jgi:hypothetical protein
VKRFFIFLLIWISQNLSIPFWMVGHVHLMMNVYDDIHEIIMSMGMNIIVAIGFYLDYKQTTKKKMGKRDKEHRKRVQARNNQLKGAEKMYQKMYQEVMKKQLEHLVAEHKAKTSGETETDETTIQEGQD